MIKTPSLNSVGLVLLLVSTNIHSQEQTTVNPELSLSGTEVSDDTGLSTDPEFARTDIDIIDTSTVELDSDIEQDAMEIETAGTAVDLVDIECRKIGGKLGSVSYKDCIQLNLKLTGGMSNNKASILYKEYPPLPQRKPLGRVLLIGGIHGDEYSSVSIVFKWLGTLDQFHSGLFHWHIVPLLNPDGLLQKNSMRMNANGVDLNRNFPIPEWTATALNYWINKTNRNPRRYPGPGAVSEPETSWLVREIDEFLPDVIVAVHAPHGVVDYDGPKSGPYKLGRLYLNLLGTYPGSLGNYAGIQKRIPVVTIELPYAGTMPSAEETADIWRDLVRWLTNNIHSNPVVQSIDQETEPS